MTDTTIGQMRQRVTLEAPLRVPDGAGGVIESWTEVAVLWASVIPRGGREAFTADGITGTLTHDVTLRPHPDLVPRNRIVTVNKTYHIHAVRPPAEPGGRVTCHCEERVL